MAVLTSDMKVNAATMVSESVQDEVREMIAMIPRPDLCVVLRLVRLDLVTYCISVSAHEYRHAIDLLYKSVSYPLSEEI